MKLVFLDVDGVLLSFQWLRSVERRSLRDWRWKIYCKAMDIEKRLGFQHKTWLTDLLDVHFSINNVWTKSCCENFNHLMAAYPDLQIVVSSSWRMRGLEKFKRIFARNGMDPKRIIGLTPRFQGEYRGYEIWRWLDEHRGAVDSFVIIDDESDMLPFMERLMKTDGYQGFTLWDVKRTAKILDKPWDGLLPLPVLHKESP